MKRSHRPGAHRGAVALARAFTVCVLIQAMMHTAHAQQMLVVDATRTWSSASQPVTFGGEARARSSWTEPVDYYGGQLHVSVEILSKPTTRPLNVKMTLAMSSGGAVAIPMPRMYGADIYMKSTPVGLLRLKTGASKPPSEVSFRKRFAMGVKGMSLAVDCGGKTQKEQTGPSAHFPMQVRVRAWAVACGASFNPHWSYDGLRYMDIEKLRVAAAQIATGRLGGALKTAKEHVADEDSETAREAREIANALERHAARRRNELFGARMESPQHCLKQHGELAMAYVGSELGREILAETRAWMRDPDVRASIEAREALADFERKLRVVKGKLAGKTVSDPAVARHRALISGLRYSLQLLEKRYPQTPRYRRANALAMTIGLSTSDVRVAAVRGAAPPPPPPRIQRRTPPPPPPPPTRRKTQPRAPRPRPAQPPVKRFPPVGGSPYVEAKPEELIENGGFETKEARARFALGWTAGQFGAFKSRYIARLDRSNAHSGERALDMRGLEREAKPGVVTIVDLEPGAYVLSLWACGDLGEQPEIGISLGTVEEWRFTANEDYRAFEKKLVISDRQRNAKLSIWVQTPASRVWIDDVSLKWTAPQGGE